MNECQRGLPCSWTPFEDVGVPDMQARVCLTCGERLLRIVPSQPTRKVLEMARRWQDWADDWYEEES